MKTVIIYDSLYGNTERIARAIGEAIPGEVKVLRVGQVDASELKALDLLFVGSPTQGGRPTEAIQDFLGQGQMSPLEGAKVAAFDTRLTAKWVRMFGYAAGKIAGSVEANGRTLLGSPGGFFVKGRKGPLAEGEVERAAAWAKEIVKISGLDSGN